MLCPPYQLTTVAMSRFEPDVGTEYHTWLQPSLVSNMSNDTNLITQVVGLTSALAIATSLSISFGPYKNSSGNGLIHIAL